MGLAAAFAAIALAVAPKPVTLLAAGDIAACESPADEATAALVARTPGVVATSGDNVYPNGTSDEFARCYAPSWGRFKARTRPSPGNHDYHTPGAAGYFGYFGARAGPPGRGYYSYDLRGGWHVVSLNSNCDAIGGCQAGSPQEQWLRADLAAHRTRCTIAYWHHPRFSSGAHGDSPAMEPLWRALYAAGADIVLNGHDHTYERFQPQSPDGRLDRRRGIRQFVVGTGGATLYPFLRVAPNSWIRSNQTHGVLRLRLWPGRYEFRFLPIRGGRFTDRGAARCG